MGDHNQQKQITVLFQIPAILLELNSLLLLRQYQSLRRNLPTTKGEGEDITVQLGQLSQALSKSPEIEALQTSISIGFPNSFGVAFDVISTRD